MGKENGSSLSDWHRQQRKKQIAKNKESRIAARDDRVKSDKTVKEVQDEIQKIEKLHKNIELRPHHVKSKLDRLAKELKIVQKVADEKAELDRQENSSSNKRPKPYYESKQQQQRQPLANPALSVYYDPVMNPFGAPPPGQPRLYHRRGGGFTMNLMEAWVPGEPVNTQPLHPPTIPRQQHNPRDRGSENRKISKDVRWNHSRNDANLNNGEQSPKMDPKQNKMEFEAKQISHLVKLPDLPRPSSAVERNRHKRKLAADIWASTEEIEYEKVASKTNLEGVATEYENRENKTKGSNSCNWQSDSWLYQDTNGNCQGPFATEHMIQWIKGGFFPLTTLVQPFPTNTHGTSNDASWVALSFVNLFKSALLGESTSDISNVNEKPAKNNSVQDRIERLRQQHSENSKPQDSDSSFESRLARLRQEHNNSFERTPVSASNTAPIDGDNMESSNVKEIVYVQGNATDDNIDAIVHDNLEVQSELINLPLNSDEAVEHPLVINTTNDFGYDDDVNQISYYVADAFPQDSEENMDDVFYPVDDDYPVTGEYPIENNNSNDDDIAVTNEYPLTDSEFNNDVVDKETVVRSDKKKKDDVVAFLPSHLTKKMIEQKSKKQT